MKFEHIVHDKDRIAAGNIVTDGRVHFIDDGTIHIGLPMNLYGVVHIVNVTMTKQELFDEIYAYVKDMLCERENDTMMHLLLKTLKEKLNEPVEYKAHFNAAFNNDISSYAKMYGSLIEKYSDWDTESLFKSFYSPEPATVGTYETNAGSQQTMAMGLMNFIGYSPNREAQQVANREESEYCTIRGINYDILGRGEYAQYRISERMAEYFLGMYREVQVFLYNYSEGIYERVIEAEVLTDNIRRRRINISTYIPHIEINIQPVSAI